MEDEEQLCTTLNTASDPAVAPKDRAIAQDLLIQGVTSQEIRDVDYTEEVHRGIVALLRRPWEANFPWDELKKLYFLFGKLVELPEFEVAKAKAFITKDWARDLVMRLNVEEPDQSYIRQFIHWTYKAFPRSRPTIRRGLGRFFGKFLKNPGLSKSINTALEVLGCIVKGFQPPLSSTHIEVSTLW